MDSIQLEVIYPLPQSWGFCLTCEVMLDRAELGDGPYERGLEEYPADWQEEYQRLASLFVNLSSKYGDNVLIRVIDPRTVQGMISALRHRVRRYPAFIVQGTPAFSGWDEERLLSLLDNAGAVPEVGG